MAKSLSFLGKHQKQRAKSGQDIFSQERPSIHILIFFLQNMGLGTKVNQDHCSGALLHQLPFVTINLTHSSGQPREGRGEDSFKLGKHRREESQPCSPRCSLSSASIVHLGVQLFIVICINQHLISFILLIIAITQVQLQRWMFQAATSPPSCPLPLK